MITDIIITSEQLLLITWQHLFRRTLNLIRSMSAAELLRQLNQKSVLLPDKKYVIVIV
jgi:hypothetical protein